ncbi:hypothetical protein WJ32_24620 [Burkholderia ubonensis]|uniref:Uncharacterized protein n=1 Tax=Burkholderia ubonensis TaxID=101571 RepID=A0A103QYY5_9BURK|nr:hypothetical protein WJ32_24620 [Burkholderia ubonensis]KVG58184.1 hypothetical protein WJ33_34595 [Burkholderia ubonensis]
MALLDGSHKFVLYSQTRYLCESWPDIATQRANHRSNSRIVVRCLQFIRDNLIDLDPLIPGECGQ